MVPRLKEIDAFVRDAVHQAMFLGNATRPATGKHKSQWLWFARAFEWIAQDRFDKIENSDRYAALSFHPKSQVLDKFRLKDGNSLNLPLHRESLFAMRRLSAI